MVEPRACAWLDFSVIIATRNRAASLQETLAALACQETMGRFTYEVVVVDNGSTDHTRRVVEERSALYPVSLRYLYEGRIGQAWALNAGLGEARGRYLAITDDDARPTSMWLSALWRCFLEEGADGVAGRVLPRWTAPRPAWLNDQVARRLGGLGCVDHGPSRLSSLQGHRCRWTGNNMAIRREVVRRLGPYATHVGQAQDTEYYLRCVRHGLKVVYEPAALTFHELDAERMTPERFRWFSHTAGYHNAYFQPPWKPVHLLTVLPVRWYLETLRIAAAWMLGSLTSRPWGERFCYELRLRLRFSLWLHRLQLWPQWRRSVFGLGGPPPADYFHDVRLIEVEREW